MDSGAPVRRRRRARAPASAVLPVLHQGAPRHRSDRFQEPFISLVTGSGRQPGPAIGQSLGNGVDLGELIDTSASTRCRSRSCSPVRPRTTSTGRRPVAGGSLRFLQRRGGSSGDVRRLPAPTRRPHHRPRRAPVAPCARPRSCSRASDSMSSSPGRWSWSTSRARRSTPVPAAPTRRCARPSRRWRSCCPWWRPTRPRTCGGAAGSPADGRARDLARRRREPAGRGDRHRRRAGDGQGARPDAGPAGHRRGRPTRAGARRRSGARSRASRYDE